MTERNSSYISLPSLFLQFLSLFFFMALLTNTTNNDHHPTITNSKRKKKKQQITKQPSSWDQIKNLLTCKQIEDSKVHDPSRPNAAHNNNNIYTSCSSICTFRDVVHGNTRVVHRADNSPESSSLGQETRLLSKKVNSHGSSSSRSVNSSSVRSAAPYTARGMQFRKLSGCYECHAIVDPTRYPLPRTTICACSECGEVFPKLESLEHHQAVRHAVSELGPEDSSRNIVEIIFKSSWLKKDNPICKIERILKVHNTQRTIQRFEDYRDTVKIRATSNVAKRNARCAADGNELLRFHCATLACSLAPEARPACAAPYRLAASAPSYGTDFRAPNQRRPHDGEQRSCPRLARRTRHRRAMLVCRVIAGRVRMRVMEEGAASPSCGAHDSVAGAAGVYSNLEELHVFSSRAILPCFVVIYKALDA
ncbi:hypothetical protein PHJA_001671700 [Phtheirospermum japonicum]|uniref:C2H2-type domain-containing protein n=1 Tax=Phtheirospermum japonicum TaxID=374723 RepID=A0A830CFY3_9LAMI|nr:hypothetical protein PHJA_001671700 [Phtheirospermum japonicum]